MSENSSKLILAGGIIGLAFLVTFGLFTSPVELEYSEPAELEPVVEVEQVDFEPGEGLEINCNPEIDKDGDSVPDNLDVEGAIDWSNCNLMRLDLSNFELSQSINLSDKFNTTSISNLSFSVK